MLVATVTPLAIFMYNGDSVVFEAMGIYVNGEINDSTWGGLFAIGTISAVLALITVFLYRHRILQIRISIFNIVMMVGFTSIPVLSSLNCIPSRAYSFKKNRSGYHHACHSNYLHYPCHSQDRC